MFRKNNFYYWILGWLSLAITACASDASDAASAAQNPTGQGGSLARFTIAGDYLYTVDNQSLHAFDISNATDPQPTSSQNIGVGIETIFPFKDLLLIGAPNGIYIYGLSNPQQPNFISIYRHILSCDPVVAQGDYAYVTLRTSSGCVRGINVLDVVDISNPSAPQLVRSLSMINPHGLGVDGNKLFVCEAQHGFKVFDISIPDSPQQVDFRDGVHSFDVIPRNDLLILTGEDGIYQYSYDQEADTLVQLSKLE